MGKIRKIISNCRLLNLPVACKVLKRNNNALCNIYAELLSLMRWMGCVKTILIIPVFFQVLFHFSFELNLFTPYYTLRNHITKTSIYSVDLLKPHFYVVKLGFTGVYIIFLISAQKHILWVLVRTASARRF